MKRMMLALALTLPGLAVATEVTPTPPRLPGAHAAVAAAQVPADAAAAHMRAKVWAHVQMVVVPFALGTPAAAQASATGNALAAGTSGTTGTVR